LTNTAFKPNYAVRKDRNCFLEGKSTCLCMLCP